MARTTIRTEDITASEVTTAKMATDPTNASNLSSGSVPLAQLGNVDTSGITANQDDIALLGFKVAANGSLARYNLVDQSIDAFEDASGVDASGSTNEVRNAANYYVGATSSTPTVTGGNSSVATDGDYTVYSYTTTGGSTFVTDTAQPMDILIVAGGGGGGGTAGGRTAAGGSGGAGGMLEGSAITVNAGTYTTTVGIGGDGGLGESYSCSEYAGDQGGNSILTETTWGTATATGGGLASWFSSTGQAGGSGGSGAGNQTAGTTSGGSGTQAASNGLTGYGNDGGGGVQYASGGSGGAGTAGGDASGTTTVGSAGTGRANSITGASVTYAPGAAGNYSTATGETPGAAAGYGAGGMGGGDTGGNGQGSAYDGGSGIIVIRRLTTSTSVADMTLVSNAQTAQSAPTNGDLVITYTNAAGTATVNTDIKAYISRNGSAYTSAVTLTSQGTTGGHTILTANGVDLSGITTGTSMRWKIETLNQSAAKETRIQAVSLGWS